MGAKKIHTDGGENHDAGKKDDTTTTVVLKVDMHCEGCASKIVKNLRAFKGVETVKAESNTGKVTVSGKVDPTKLRDSLAEKIKKKVELVSPQPKKEKEKAENKDKDTETNNKAEKKTEEKKINKDKQAVTTAVLKVPLHCQGCIDRIGKFVLKTKGVEEMSMDKEKDTVTVKGTMEVKALVGNLTERLRKKVEVVPPKKDKDNDNKEEGAGGGKKKNKGNGGGEGGGDNNEKDEGVDGKLIEHNMRGYLAPAAAFGFGGYGYNNGYGYGPYAGGNIGGGYNYGPPGPVHPEQFHHFQLMHAQQPPPHQMFSDENPNACSVM
ncbi:heavy metal-associated isoprenylated plant protein 3-like isoform X2 [Lotus japonicus]|uniref:heavy metal-associated isoprenylated plant protein 3-like isoform X2 n=1 Tax=Lotus japonicus TaxID=34305 RepID=UPI00258E68C8|nr:heavy metal-associated isoprenylated plant protein 3-like isoform X2 [Lotus japonicus]